MPAKINFIRIEFTDFKEIDEGGCICRLRFKVEPAQAGIKFVYIFFTEEFVEDYFRIPDSDRWQDILEEEVFKEKRDLFVEWGLVKIEDMLDKRSLCKRTVISRNEFEWAEQIQQGRVISSSDRVAENVFQFSPKRTIIGFRP